MKGLAFVAVGMLALSFAAFGPSLSNEFVNYDDPVVIVENDVIEGLTVDHFRAVFSRVRDYAYLPMWYASYWVDHALFGKRPLGYHLINILLHALNGLLLFCIVRRLSRPARDGDPRLAAPSIWAGVAAALWLTHPVLTESVVWASGRKDLLSLSFAAAALLSYLKGLENGRDSRIIVWPLILFGLAGLTKASVLVLPALAWLAHRELSKQGRLNPEIRQRSVLALRALTVLALLFVSLHVLVAARQGTIGGEAISGIGRAVGMVGVLAKYIGHLLFPANLSVCYPNRIEPEFTTRVMHGFAVILVAAGLALHWFRRGGLFGLGIIWLFVALSPFNNVAPRFSISMADRYLYLGAAGLAIAVAAGLRGLAIRRQGPLALGIVACALAATICGANQRSRVWHDSETLWRDARIKAPGETLPCLQLGHALEQASGNLRGPRARQVVEEATGLYETGLRLAADPGQAMQARLKLASAFVVAGRFAEALQTFVEIEAALTEHDLSLESEDRDNLAVTRASALFAVGRFDEARDSLSKVRSSSPATLSARNMRATIDVFEASESLRRARAPETEASARALYDRGLAAYRAIQATWPRDRKSRLDYLKALMGAAWIPDYHIETSKVAHDLVDDFPKDAMARYLRAKVYADVDPEQAMADLKISIGLDPYRSSFYLLLSELCRRGGRNKDAKLVLDQGRDKLPDSAEIRGRLAEIYVAFAYHHRNSKSPELAIESADRALFLDGSLVEARLIRGEIRRELASSGAVSPQSSAEFWESSAADFDRVLELDPKNARAKTGKAHFHRARGYGYLSRTSQLKSGLSAEEKKERKRQIRRTGMEEFVRACELGGDVEAFDALRSIIAAYAAEHAEIAEKALEELRSPDAVDPARVAIEFDPENPERHALLGRIEARLGRYPEAIAAYRAALKIDVNHPRSLFELGRLYFDDQKWSECAMVLERFVEALPLDASAGARGGEALLEIHRSARAMIKEALEHLDGGRE